MTFWTVICTFPQNPSTPLFFPMSLLQCFSSNPLRTRFCNFFTMFSFETPQFPFFRYKPFPKSAFYNVFRHPWNHYAFQSFYNIFALFHKMLQKHVFFRCFFACFSEYFPSKHCNLHVFRHKVLGRLETQIPRKIENFAIYNVFLFLSLPVSVAAGQLKYNKKQSEKQFQDPLEPRHPKMVQKTRKHNPN